MDRVASISVRSDATLSFARYEYRFRVLALGVFWRSKQRHSVGARRLAQRPVSCNVFELPAAAPRTIDDGD